MFVEAGTDADFDWPQHIYQEVIAKIVPNI